MDSTCTGHFYITVFFDFRRGGAEVVPGSCRFGEHDEFEDQVFECPMVSWSLIRVLRSVRNAPRVTQAWCHDLTVFVMFMNSDDVWKCQVPFALEEKPSPPSPHASWSAPSAHVISQV